MTEVLPPESAAAPAVTLPAGIASQAAEAEQPPVVLNTKVVMWRDRTWNVRSKPGARFLAAFEDDKIMTAVKTVIGDKQYAELLELDPDVDGDEGLEGFVNACNRVWGLEEGN